MPRLCITPPIPLLYHSYTLPTHPRLLVSSSPRLLALPPRLASSPRPLFSVFFNITPSPSERPEEVSKYTDSNSILNRRGESPPRADTRLTSLSLSARVSRLVRRCVSARASRLARVSALRVSLAPRLAHAWRCGLARDLERVYRVRQSSSTRFVYESYCCRV